MAGNPGLRKLGKIFSYFAVFFEMYLIFRKPFEGNALILAHAFCIGLLVAGLLIFRKNLE